MHARGAKLCAQDVRRCSAASNSRVRRRRTHARGSQLQVWGWWRVITDVWDGTCTGLRALEDSLEGIILTTYQRTGREESERILTSCDSDEIGEVVRESVGKDTSANDVIGACIRQS